MAALPPRLPLPDVSSARGALSSTLRYVRGDLRYDLVAGLTVAIMGVPQGMAYAWIAGVPPIYGLYTSIVSCAVGALLGSSSHLITGPTNASCMVIFSIVAPYLRDANHMEIVFFLSFLAGLIKLAFGLFRAGGSVRYVSNSVLIGFTIGVAILIVGNQAANVLGVEVDFAKANRFYKVIAETIRQTPAANFYTLAVALLTVLATFGAQRLHPKLPAPLLAMVLATLAVYLLDWHARGVGIVRDIAEIRGELAIFHVPELLRHPSLKALEQLSAGALAIAVFGLIEASTSARAVGALSGQRVRFSREFIGQGLANIVGSFFMNLPSSGSFVRTALCYQSGARTRLAALYSGAFIALTILLFAPLANYIPQASLAGSLVYVAWGMIAEQKRRIAITWNSGRNSRLVFAATLAATLLIPLQYAIFVGVFLSIALLLRITGTVDLTVLVPRAGGRFDELPFGQNAEAPIALVNLEGDLYFAAVENLDSVLERALSAHTRVVVLRMKRLRAVGSTAMSMLEHFWSLLRERDIALVVCGVEKSLAGLMQRSGLSASIGEPNIFYADNTLFQSTELAMARARGIVEMERRREAPALAPSEPTGLKASDILSRQCVRFGQGHTVREAIWLMSEINRRSPSPCEAQPLFLQDTSGRLAGSLSPECLLREMTGALSREAMEAVDDRALGHLFCGGFDRVIGEIARKDLPTLAPQASLANLLNASLTRDLRALPICDESHRAIGIVSQDALLRGLGRALHLLDSQTESSES